MADQGGEESDSHLSPTAPRMILGGQLSSAVYLEKREDIDLYADVMDRLGARALTPQQTRNFIAEVRDKA
jgi:hypothetical protein